MRRIALFALPLVALFSTISNSQTTPKTRPGAAPAVTRPAPGSPTAPRANAAAQALKEVASVEGITEYVLPNGLHVLLFPDPSKPKVTVNITYLVGSRFEGYGETGMAHLLEHLMFLQTKTRANIKKELTDHGADMNGSTGFDRTNYYETLTASDENLRWALRLEADRMVNIRLEKPILDTEMTVVRNEFEMGENNPGHIVMQRGLETAYTWHNYGHLPIGNRSDIENVPIERLAAFYQKYYQPDNAYLIVAGKFDQPATMKWIAELFGPIPKPKRVIQKTYTVEPTQDGERSVTLSRVGDVQELLAVYHIPAAAHADSEPLEVLAGVLGDAPAGRLYKQLVETKKAVSVSADPMAMHDPGVLMASATLRQDQSLDDARQILLQTMENLAAQPPTKEEVERVKTKLLKEIDLALADTQNVALWLSEALGDGDWRLLFYSRDRLKNVTEQDVARVAAAYLKSSNRTLAEFIPMKNAPERATIPPAPEVSKLLKDYKGDTSISQGEVFDPTPANIEKRVTRSTLPGGMKLVLLPKKTRGGTLVAQLVMRFGDDKSLFGKSTAGEMAGAMLMRGSKNKTRQQIQDEMNRLKANISISGGANNVTARIETVEANFPAALRLAVEVLREPSFPEAEFEQIRQQRIAATEQRRTDPSSIAINDVQRTLSDYQRGDIRHVATPDETIEDLKKVTLAEARDFYSHFYGASNSQFVVVGQFDPAAVQQLASQLLGNWKSPQPFQRISYAYKKTSSGEKKIETPDKENAMLVTGAQVRLSQTDPDYPAMELANYMMGGSMASRLWRRIRDKEGLSYSVQSALQVRALDEGSLFLALAQCAPQNAPKTEAALKDEIARAAKEGFAANEVTDAKKAWLQEQMVARSQDEALAASLATLEYYGWTMKFDEDVENKVAALTADQVSAAFRKLIDPSALALIKAGNFKKAAVYQ
jgi:zinc protease